MPHPEFRKTSSRGFTLMELLVVIAIITVLAILSLPVYSRVLESSRNVKCISNLKNMGVALASYVGDHDGWLIPYASMDGAKRFWFDDLRPYMGEDPKADFSLETHPCPWQICPSKPVLPESRQAVGYGWNHRYLGYLSSDPRGGPARMTEITHPSRTIVIGDSIDIPKNTTPPAVSQNRYLYSQDYEKLPARHSGYGNYLMLDGHVVSLKPGEIGENSPDKTPEGVALWWKDKSKKK